MMKKWMIGILAVSLAFFITGCEEDTPDYAADIINTYRVESVTFSGDTVDMTALPLEESIFVVITRDDLTIYTNDADPCDTTYETDIFEIDAVTKTVIRYSDDSEDSYSLENGKLHFESDGDMLILGAYTGTVPPAVWTDPSLLPNDTYEPNNTMTTATPIAAGGTVQNHYLGQCEDKDYFMFSAVNQTSYVLETSSPNFPDLDMELTLYSGAGVELASDDDSGMDWNPSLFWTCEASGDYYFLLEGWWFGEFGNYSVFVTEVTGMLKPAVAPEPKKTRETISRDYFRDVFHH